MCIQHLGVCGQKRVQVFRGLLNEEQSVLQRLLFEAWQSLLDELLGGSGGPVQFAVLARRIHGESGLAHIGKAAGDSPHQLHGQAGVGLRGPRNSVWRKQQVALRRGLLRDVLQ